VLFEEEKNENIKIGN